MFYVKNHFIKYSSLSNRIIPSEHNSKPEQKIQETAIFYYKYSIATAKGGNLSRIFFREYIRKRSVQPLTKKLHVSQKRRVYLLIISRSFSSPSDPYSRVVFPREKVSRSRDVTRRGRQRERFATRRRGNSSGRLEYCRNYFSLEKFQTSRSVM